MQNNNIFSKSPNVFLPEKPPLLIMNIELGSNYQKQLIIHADDNIQEKALNFCIDNGLQEDCAAIFIEKIKENLEQKETLNEFPTKKRSLEDIYSEQKKAHSQIKSPLEGIILMFIRKIKC